MHTEGDRNEVSVGDHAPAARAWRVWRVPLQRYLARRLSGPADAEDALQMVFLNFHRAFPGDVEPDVTQAWLFRAARNVALDRLKARRRQRVEGVGATDALDRLSVASAASSLQQRSTGPSMSACVRPLVERMPDRYRDALTLTDLGGLTQADAAARLGLSLPGMKARVQRGRQRLRDGFLACCDLAFDRRGAIVSAQVRTGHASPCHAGAEDAGVRPLPLIRKKQSHS
jgi:RNA polymerase sigma-70 factor (ECF subfamily)